MEYTRATATGYFAGSPVTGLGWKRWLSCSAGGVPTSSIAVERAGGWGPKGRSVYVGDPGGRLFGFMMYPDEAKECAHGS
jgi:hypothetical protein